MNRTVTISKVKWADDQEMFSIALLEEGSHPSNFTVKANERTKQISIIHLWLCGATFEAISLYVNLL